LAPVISYGFLAVPLFFIISGFVITASAAEKTAPQFAWGRFVRLFPTFWICLTLTWLVVNRFGPDAYHTSLLAFVTNFTMVADLFKQPLVDGPYWTLGAELRFYVLIYFLILCQMRQHLLKLATVWLLLSCIDFWVKIPLLRDQMILAYAPFFVAGMVYQEMFQRGVKRYHWGLLAISCLLGAARTCKEIDHENVHTGWHPSHLVICCLIGVIYLVFLGVATRVISIKKSHRWITALGGITYPLYLLHNNLGLTICHQLGERMDRWIQLGLLSVCFILVAYIMWRFVETPIIAKLNAKYRKTVDFRPEKLSENMEFTKNEISY
jgi:peptidoglycan/LPS O-acetylase OafA/YrhL